MEHGGASPSAGALAADVRTLVLRPERDADVGFTFALFAANNAPALAGTGLPPAAVDGLVNMQFRAQTEQYRIRFPDARRSIVKFAERSVGRLVVAWEERDLYVVDIVIMPEAQRRGLGGAAVATVQREATAEGLGVRALVMPHNGPSLAMFRRRGFAPTGRTVGPSLELRWTA